MEIKILKKDEIGFPTMLKNIYDCPKQLYVLGNVENLRKECVSIVGSRKCSLYGRNQAEKIAYKLSNEGKVIVSGLALGIDSCAHIGALKANGRTIAVLAHGLNKIYPPQNRELAIQILKHNGTIISEYSISEIMKKENFERRNRIISGLSSKTIVVEAAIKSGALITANYAMEQGRSVIAVPGNIDSKYSQGTNKLLKIGAEIYL